MMNNYQKLFISEFEKLTYRHQRWQVFSDFCEMATLSLAQPFRYSDEREKRYLEMAGRYSREEIDGIGHLMGIATHALEVSAHDFLGGVFMELELFNHWKGQYFTPMSIAGLMAGITLDGDIEERMKAGRIVTMSEPACGSGAMLISMADQMRTRGLQVENLLHVTATDVDPTAAHMCYIQVSLLSIPAVVVIGNTLSMQMTEQYYTFAHDMFFWDHKLKRDRANMVDDHTAKPQTPTKILQTVLEL